MVSWKKITKPKREGGLDIHVAKAKNIAFLAKLNWRLKTKTTSLWARLSIGWLEDQPLPILNLRLALIYGL